MARNSSSNGNVVVPSAQAQNIDALYGVPSPELTAWHRACALAADGFSATAEAGRLAKGLALAQGGHVHLDPDADGDWGATVQSGKLTYTLEPDGTCPCPDYVKHPAQDCKHLLAVAIHLKAEGLLPGQTSQPPSPISDLPSPISDLPTSLPQVSIDNPAGANFKARIGNCELWFTWHGASDQEVLGRMQATLPVLQELVEACEQQQRERQVSPPPVPTAPELIPPPRPGNGQVAVDWCPTHQVVMSQHQNERGTWYSHRLAGGGWCRGKEA